MIEEKKAKLKIFYRIRNSTFFAPGDGGGTATGLERGEPEKMLLKFWIRICSTNVSFTEKLTCKIFSVKKLPANLGHPTGQLASDGDSPSSDGLSCFALHPPCRATTQTESPGKEFL